MWDKIIEKYYPSITYVLIAEECGNGIYINTDLTGDDFSTRFSVDFKLSPKYNPLCEYGFYADCEEELIEMFNNIFHRKYKSFKQCKKRLFKESLFALFERFIFTMENVVEHFNKFFFTISIKTILTQRVIFG